MCYSRHSSAAVVQANKLVAQAEWCRRYAQINSVALRKVPSLPDDRYLGPWLVQTCHARRHNPAPHAPLRNDCSVGRERPCCQDLHGALCALQHRINQCTLLARRS